MNAIFTSASTEAEFIPGPNVEIAAGGTFTWEDVIEEDVRGNQGIVDLVAAGTITVAVGYTVAELALITGFEGQLEYATNGRKTGEGALAGTGVPVYYSNAAWRRLYDDAAVTA